MRKSLQFIILTIISFVASFGLKAQEDLAEPAAGKKIVYNKVMYQFLSLENKTVMTTYAMGTDINGQNCDKLTGDVVIPEKITYKGVDYTVVEVGAFTFMKPSGADANLKSVKLPNTIVKINDSAFSGSMNLTSVTLSTACKSIGGQAFANCTGLTHIELPEGLEELGSQCFVRSGIQEMIIPNSVVTMGDAVMASMSSLKKVKFGTGLKALPPNCLMQASALTELDLGQVEEIGSFALDGLSAITSIHFPATVKSFGDRALILQNKVTSYTVDPSSPYLASVNGVLYSKDLKSIIKYPMGLKADTYNIPEGVTSIGDCGFERASFTHLKMPATLESIGKYAFWSNENLNAADFNNCNLKFMDEGAFTQCGALKSMTLPNSPVKVGDLAWYMNSSLTEIDLGGAVSLGDLVFQSCAVLKSVNIPASTTSIGASIFSGCDALESVTVSPESNTFTAKDNVIFSKDMTQIMIYPEVLKAEEYVVPASVKTVYFGCFMNCANLKKLNLGENTEKIEGTAMRDCKNLVELTLGPNTKELATMATLGCNALRTVYMKPTTPPVYLDKSQFPYNMNSKGTLYVPKGTLDVYKAATPWNNVKNIQEMDFSGIEDIDVDKSELTISVDNGTLSIEGAEGLMINVYDTLGREIYSGYNISVSGLRPGLYIVRIGNVTKKVMI